MEGYGCTYPPHFPQMAFPGGEFLDHGDGFGEYYDSGPINGGQEVSRSARSKHRRSRKRNSISRSRSKSVSKSRSRHSQSRSRTRTRSRSKTRTRSTSGSQTRSLSDGRKKLYLKEPSILDAFRVLYLTSSKHKKSATKYLATKKRQDRVQELLKRDGLGSKRWLFYPRPRDRAPGGVEALPSGGDKCDRRVKLDGDFFRKYKTRKRIDSDAPIAKLNRWELLLYKKLGFIQAV